MNCNTRFYLSDQHKSQKLDNSHFGDIMGKQTLFICHRWDCKIIQLLKKQVGNFSLNGNCFNFWVSNATPWNLFTDTPACLLDDMCVRLFIWYCKSKTSEISHESITIWAWLNNLWHIYRMKYYVIVRKKTKFSTYKHGKCHKI